MAGFVSPVDSEPDGTVLSYTKIVTDAYFLNISDEIKAYNINLKHNQCVCVYICIYAFKGSSGTINIGA